MPCELARKPLLGVRLARREHSRNTEQVEATWNDAVCSGDSTPLGYVIEWDSQPCDLIPCSNCEADVDRNGVVGVSDLIFVIAQWGSCPPNCPGDVDGDGVVGVSDLLEVILAWGSCP